MSKMYGTNLHTPVHNITNKFGNISCITLQLSIEALTYKTALSYNYGMIKHCLHNVTGIIIDLFPNTS